MTIVSAEDRHLFDVSGYLVVQDATGGDIVHRINYATDRLGLGQKLANSYRHGGATIFPEVLTQGTLSWSEAVVESRSGQRRTMLPLQVADEQHLLDRCVGD